MTSEMSNESFLHFIGSVHDTHSVFDLTPMFKLILVLNHVSVFICNAVLGFNSWQLGLQDTL